MSEDNGVTVEEEVVPDQPKNIGTDERPKYEFFTCIEAIPTAELTVASFLFGGKPVALEQEHIIDTLTEQGEAIDLVMVKITLERVSSKPANSRTFTNGN